MRGHVCWQVCEGPCEGVGQVCEGPCEGVCGRSVKVHVRGVCGRSVRVHVSGCVAGL